MILVIDNYDSFTFNLVQYLGEWGAEMRVERNDQITIDQIRRMKPSRILISPGPGSPSDAGISNEVIRVFGPRIPVLGVCLGHQCMAFVYGGRIVRAPRLMHGKTSFIEHSGESVLDGMENPFEATRYHSLIVERETLPSDLHITAKTAEGEIMGLRHATFPIHGVQFHPESILTQNGRKIMRNFLALQAG